jgi:hypothetical protein
MSKIMRPETKLEAATGATFERPPPDLRRGAERQDRCQHAERPTDRRAGGRFCMFFSHFFKGGAPSLFVFIG